ncbi:protein AAR2 homolog [Varroa jacobsoni]|uniref:protein AAR2 homolog n=1 Tax=Varroa jacobsoni TaxID=62625 RepID=UPI000BF8E556|nr:protein AAR2 homolog [Varroa jacobsoni]
MSLETEDHLRSQDPELIKKLAETGATLVILDLPVGSEFGIDMKQWEIGEKFRGIKMIPPGIHYVYYSYVNKDIVAPRTGFFHNFVEKTILAFRWDTKEEIIVKVTDDELACLALNLRKLDRFLGPYPFETLRQWTALSDRISKQLIEKLEPPGGLIFSVQQFEPAKYLPTKSGTDTRACKMPNLIEMEATKMRFTPIPKRWHPSGSSASEVTRCSMDGSYVLDQLLKRHGGNNDLLGEIQMAFVTFLCGQLFEGFEQWKRLLAVICSAESCISRQQMEPLFLAIISLLHFQLKEVPSDLFMDIVSRENFLVVCLSNFFRNIAESAPPSGPLRNKANRFRVYLTRTFKWDFDQEPEEDQPQVVELDNTP